MEPARQQVNCATCRHWSKYAEWEGFCDNVNSTHCASITDSCFTCPDHKEHPDDKPSEPPIE